MISVVKGDITKLTVDAIVNAANNDLTDGAGVNGAIHRAAGHELAEACGRITGGCPTGEARITPAGRLHSRYVIHAVGPVWQGGDHDEAEILSRTYHHIFRLALDYDVRTIALPSISTGVFGFPKRQAAEIALKKIRHFDDHFAEIICCVFSDEDEAIYLKLLD